MEPDSVSLTQFPSPLSHDDYELGRQRIVEEFCDRDGLLGIYDYGTVQHPGISDLDLMFVFEQDSTPPWVADLSTAFDPLVDELVGRGNVIVIDEQTFRQLNFIDPHLEPKHVAGDRLSRENVDTETATYRNYASVMDWLPERVYQIQRLAVADEIPIMRTLQLLKSLGYSLRIVDELHSFDPGVSFADSVESLRSSWFDYSQRKQKEVLFETVEEAKAVGSAALDFWFDHRPAAVFTGEPYSSSDTKSVLSYFDGLAYVSGTTGVSRGEDWVRIGIPNQWFAHYTTYADHDSRLGELIDRSLITEQSEPHTLSSGYEQYLHEKLSICSGNFEWVQDSGLGSGTFRFGFLLHRCNWSPSEFEQFRTRLQSVVTS